MEVLTKYGDLIYDAEKQVSRKERIRVTKIPGCKLDPKRDITAIENMFAPWGNVKERFAYESWPAEMRKEYINSDVNTRRNMVNAAFGRG